MPIGTSKVLELLVLCGGCFVRLLLLEPGEEDDMQMRHKQVYARRVCEA